MLTPVSDFTKCFLVICHNFKFILNIKLLYKLNEVITVREKNEQLIYTIMSFKRMEGSLNVLLKLIVKKIELFSNGARFDKCDLKFQECGVNKKIVKFQSIKSSAL